MKKFYAMAAALALTAGLGTAPAMAVSAERELVSFEAPEYPRAAQRRNLEGHVTVRYTVNEDGEVSDVEVVEATPAGVFERAVMRALEAWRYAAGDRNENMERRFDFAFSD
ncbi:energy transducer TonB [Alkalicaulis satelles]|uniref:Protein TonB n=1 Tax=Alkalicaulis satelles TaxID=2609175 RepID=A0A5M6ZDB7_9PROT|nr:energy transducer TonB [Alkalicaulis satelles]KAA5801068.1 energy transducer TonB [Alkalicaulis satelles]